MNNQSAIYPNLNWAQFEVINDNRTDAFEEMCTDLFFCEYLKERRNPHADHNNPGVEVLPILEPLRDDGQPQRWISFQAKYFDTSISDAKIIGSLKQAVKHYAGKLDVIYLFCNKTITTTSSRYHKYEEVLRAAQIKLELVTNKDIFVLLRKHRRVADYYFQDRRRALVETNNLLGVATFASTVSDTSTIEYTEMPNALLQELLKEKSQKCKLAICDLRFGDLKSELNMLSKIGADNSDNCFRFYRIILAAHEKKGFSHLIEDLPQKFMEDAYWLKNFVNNIRAMSINEFIGLSIETQIVVLDILFSSQRWDEIVELNKDRERMHQDVLKAFDFHFGLSQFNLGECEQAHETLNSLFDRYHEQRFKLYDICALLRKQNKEFVYGVPQHSDNVKQLLSSLETVKELVTDQIVANEPLIAMLELQACFNLGISEKQYLSEAHIRYEGYSDATKTNDGVRLFSALCYEMEGNLEAAKELLSSCAWKEDEAIASRYLTLFIDLKEPQHVITSYAELSDAIMSPRIEAIHLLAMHRLGDPKYKEKLQFVINRIDISLSDILIIGFYVEDHVVFDEIVFPKLSTMIPGHLSEITLQDKIILLTVFANNNKLQLLEAVLDSMQDVLVINRFVSHNIYRCLFNAVNKEYKIWQYDEITQLELRKIEKIADRFIEADIQKKNFLQIKLLCASANHMVFSMLKYSKELFELSQDIQSARNVVTLLYERNETKAEEYEPYLSVLEESEDPDNSMVVAWILVKLGQYEEASYYAYKAIYNLNGRDDFAIYKKLFGYQGRVLQIVNEKPKRRNISSNMIVTLKSNEETWAIALDSENAFGDNKNRSLGVEHIGRTDPVYTKLIGKGKNQVLNLRGKSYKVVGFEPREHYIERFIFQKVQEHPTEFKDCAWVIATDNTDEMIKQLLTISDNRQQIKTLVDSYNFGDNDYGIPIDFFIIGDYEKYISVQQYLLFGKDLAYYAGEPRPENIIDTKYIPTLSTLTLLASKEWLDVLDWLGDRIIIPESYIDFFREQYAFAVAAQNRSATSLVPLENGKYTILDYDKRIPEIWESIISKCDIYPTVKVTDDERILFEVLDGYTWERLFSNARIDKIQIDAMIVAERERGVYLCDDLFFRKIATLKKIKNINFSSVLYIHSDLDVVMPIVLELSKTNYVYVPFICRNNDECKQLVQNLLEGEKKKTYYTDFFNSYINVYDEIMRQYFGESQEEED